MLLDRGTALASVSQPAILPMQHRSSRTNCEPSHSSVDPKSAADRPWTIQTPRHQPQPLASDTHPSAAKGCRPSWIGYFCQSYRRIRRLSFGRQCCFRVPDDTPIADVVRSRHERHTLVGDWQYGLTKPPHSAMSDMCPIRFDFPMRRNFPQPRDPRIAHRHARIEPLRHRVADERGALLGQQRQQPFLLRDQRVEPGGLAVEEGGDGALFRSSGGKLTRMLAICALFARGILVP